MDPIMIEFLGLIAGAVTSLGFIPQLIKGYKTKKLEDVSYYMPVILAIGMSLWLVYGIVITAFAVIIANAFGIFCCLTLIALKRKYS
jgi:MtN3 and saliva related transmembrane protein